MKLGPIHPARERRVRVCHLLPCLKHGGAEAQVLLNIETTDRARFAVYLCLMKEGDPYLEARVETQLVSLLRLGFRWRSAIKSALQLRSFLRRTEIDILHCHLPLADSFGRLVGLWSGVQVLITTEHGKHLWKRPPHLLLERFLNRRTAARICVSQDIAEIRREREGLAADKSTVIPNAVNLDRIRTAARSREAVLAEFGWGNETELVVAVGRLVDAKDYPLLIAAMALLRRSRLRVRCLIAGDGPLRQELQERIEAEGLRSTVVLCGSRNDVPDLLHAADLYVLSSLREGLPVALLEAMACGLPVVATPAGGVREILENGVNGLSVPHGNPEAMADALDSILADPGRAKVMGRMAARDVEEGYDIETVIRRVEAIYLKTLDRLDVAAAELGQGRSHSDGGNEQ